jgi:hypothetical protein
MRRRDFVILLAGAMGGRPYAVRTQQKAMPVTVVLHTASPGAFAPYGAAFRQGLSEAGYVEGQNVAIEYRGAEGQYDRLPALAAELVGRKVDVIVSTGAAPTALDPALDPRPRRRGDRVTPIAAALALWLCAIIPAFAQNAENLPIVGILRINTPDTVEPFATGFKNALTDRGLVDGRNIHIDVRLAEGHVERLPELARSLVGAKASVIVALGPAIRAAQQATSTIPIRRDLRSPRHRTDPELGQARRQHHRGQHAHRRARRQEAGDPEGDPALSATHRAAEHCADRRTGAGASEHRPRTHVAELGAGSEKHRRGKDVDRLGASGSKGHFATDHAPRDGYPCRHRVEPDPAEQAARYGVIS